MNRLMLTFSFFQEHYYQPPKGRKSARGYIEDRLCNMRRKQKKTDTSKGSSRCDNDDVDGDGDNVEEGTEIN